jgi:DNA adenine methylase
MLTQAAAGKLTVHGTIYASDLNETLIGLYKNVQANPRELIRAVAQLVDDFSKCVGTTVNRKATTLEEAMSSPESYYFWVRTQFNSLESRVSIAASAMMLFMNKTCFRGLYREGPNGFNVPFGNNKNPTILDEVNILELSSLFQGVIFEHCSFQKALASVQPGDFVYLDPPYVPVDMTSFVAYTMDGFNLEQHTSLFKFCTEMKTKFLMSNADVPLVAESFAHYAKQKVSCRRSINSKNPGSMANELLIHNF